MVLQNYQNSIELTANMISENWTDVIIFSVPKIYNTWGTIDFFWSKFGHQMAPELKNLPPVLLGLIDILHIISDLWIYEISSFCKYYNLLNLVLQALL